MRRKPLILNRDGSIKITEKMVRKQINQYLKLKGIFYWHNLAGLGSYRGLPDIEGVAKSRHFYIEVKSPKSRGQSEEQQEFQIRVESEKEIYILANSLDIVIEKFNFFGLL